MFFLLLLPVVVSGFSQTYYPMPEYKFSWTADLVASKLHTEVVLTPPSGQTFGWVGFGIAGGAGGMLGGDMFTAYWANTTCAIQDRRASSTSKSRPAEDITSNGFADWTIDSCSLNGAVFTIAATRAFVTFDEFDLDFVTGPMLLLFAWSKAQPSSPSTISFHDGGFAPKELSLWGAQVLPFNKSNLESDYDVVELRMPNVTIGNQTHYTCFGFNINLKNNAPTQAVAFEALINPANIPYVHHIILYACSSLNHTEPFDCVTMPPACQSGIMYAWGVGGNPFVLPPVTGLDIGILNRQFFAMQMHYNNVADVQNLVDTSGVAIYRTNQQRPNRTQFFFTGSLKLNLTYGKTQIGVAGHCNETLGKTSWPAGGLNIYSTMVHAHQRGRRLWTVLMRNGSFVTTIGNNQAYDFNLQKTVSLVPYVKLYPGDQLLTYCVWDTSKDTQNVLYGETTAHEMCINFLAFYPSYSNTSHVTCGVNTNPYEATNPGPNSCVLLPYHPPAAYEFKNWTVSDYYYMAGGVATCAPGFEGTPVLGCPGFGAPFSFAGCRRKFVNVSETVAPTPGPVVDSAFVPAVSFAFAWLLLFV